MKFFLLTILAMGTFHQALASPLGSEPAIAKRQGLVSPWQPECSPGTIPNGGDPTSYCTQRGISCDTGGKLQCNPYTTTEGLEEVCFEICYCHLNADIDPPIGRV
ncbi:hypothetical protein QBC36DRAFT_233864 [Triangularia setosa]|uniref:Uncharacterized protein n=1 Tax=Triangularia setosa TaxID=2587417 RepID=A0AAN6WCP9_9PEZI|nr:hypothetical protein QBC36DRAFT_233864 [Podospora setosa]